jgi:hypothetical protein
MRSFTILAFTATAVVSPVFAVADPMQAPAAASAQAAPASTEAPAAAQATGPTQAPAAPSQSATAATQTGPEAVIVRGDPVDLDQIACRDVSAPIGSRIGGGRECHTEREWRRRQQESQDALRRHQRMGYAAP